jgi:hypothetical protein
MATDYDEEIRVYEDLRAKQAGGMDVVCRLTDLATALVNKGLAKTQTAALRRLDKIIAAKANRESGPKNASTCKALHVDITVPGPDPEHPLDLFASFCGCERAGEHKVDVLQRAKVALAAYLVANHQTAYCDSAFALDDTSFLETMERILAFQIHESAVIDCNCDHYGECLASAQVWERLNANA